MTLTCSINGSSFGSCKNSVSGSSKQKHTITVRATNAEGLSAEASDSASAPTAKPTPSVGGERTAGAVSGQEGCKNGGCYYIDFTVSGLEPNTSYSYCVKGGGAVAGKCWYPAPDGVNYDKPGTLTTDSNGRWQLRGGGRTPFWGNPNAPVWIWVEKDGQSTDSNQVYPLG